MKHTDYLSEKIHWRETDDPEHPFEAVHKGEMLTLRLNDFPAEPLYTLLANGEEVTDVEDFSDNWSIEELAVFDTSSAN